ncbi:branched-chain amino acid ABC transporter permease [Herbaspirillum sp.]|uniref:branched-chain amino acid ABC transporter permease n=1 Tax=Herbaspirillum sp. TaxID=1890675 RepID=UPI0031E05239
MIVWIETFINGITLGALYGLFGLGLSLSLGVMRMINIAHGDLIVLGAYLASIVMAALHCGPFTSLLVVLPVMFCIGWLLQRCLLNFVVGLDPLAPLLLTFGLSIVLQNLFQEIFTADTRSLPSGDISLAGFQLAGVSLGLLPVLTTVISVLVFAIVSLLLSRTSVGRQARAVADDLSTARLVGIDGHRFFALVTGFIMVAVSLASVLYGIRAPFSPTSGPERLLYSFEAVVLGGLGNVWGTLLGGMAIGVAQLMGAKVNASLGPFFGHLVFLVALIVRPQGLFSRAKS